MEMMAVDPKSRILAPRLLAGIVSMPLLAILFSAVGILGAYVVAVLLIGVDAGNFWSIMQSRVDVWRDVGNGIVKSFVFGVICTVVALYQGHETEATPEGVAYATTRTVVISSLGVLAMDFVLTPPTQPTMKRCGGLTAAAGSKKVNKRNVEILVGLFVLMGMAGLVFLALKAANLASFGARDGYAVTARFDNIGGLKPRSPVRSAGVTVGRVKTIALDPKTFEGVVTMELDSSVRFPRDSSAKILTAGLLGDQYIGIEAGASDQDLVAGGQIRQTQSAVVLENLIGQLVTGKAAEAADQAGEKK
jgi:outer membrane lipid asymmetry maintenance protein MlaD